MQSTLWMREGKESLLATGAASAGHWRMPGAAGIARLATIAAPGERASRTGVNAEQKQQYFIIVQ
jgi:hypothetical protein